VPPRRTLAPRTPRLGALGDAIRNSREEAHLSQKELGARAGLHATHVSGLERGARNPTYETLAQIAEALDMSVGALAAMADRVYEGLARDEHDPGG
jgi:transcriptional regulator with XRE-family HTH domain